MDWTNKRKVAAQILFAFLCFTGSYALFMPATSRLRMMFVALCGTVAFVGYAYLRRNRIQPEFPA